MKPKMTIKCFAIISRGSVGRGYKRILPTHCIFHYFSETLNTAKFNLILLNCSFTQQFCLSVGKGWGKRGGKDKFLSIYLSIYTLKAQEEAGSKAARSTGSDTFICGACRERRGTLLFQQAKILVINK